MSADDYGVHHRTLRTYWNQQILAGTNPPCSRCGHPVLPTDTWDLDHTDDRTDYLGPAHATCNRRAGAQKKNKLYARHTTHRTRSTRNW